MCLIVCVCFRECGSAYAFYSSVFFWVCVGVFVCVP